MKSYPWSAEELFFKEEARRWEMAMGVFINITKGILLKDDKINVNIKKVISPIISGEYFIKNAIVRNDKHGSSQIKWQKPLHIEIKASQQSIYEEEVFHKSILKKKEKPKVVSILFDRFANPIYRQKRVAVYNNKKILNGVKWYSVKGTKGKTYQRGFLLEGFEDFKYKLFWGDIHSHTEMSGHGYGDPEQIIKYAKDISNIDFYAQVDHLHFLTEQDREATKHLMEKYNKHGTFITLHGYEYQCQMQGANNTIPANHYNIYFRDEKDWFLPEKKGKIYFNNLTIEELLKQMKGKLLDGKAIIIAHQLGERCSQNTWHRTNSPFEPLVEIYSHHGTSEHYDPKDPLFYNNVHHIEHENHNHDAMKGPHYVRDAWKSERRLGVIASSDSHIGKPGVNSWGLTGVYAKKLDRESIFEAFLKRRTYATTGEKIILYLKADGHFMGEEFCVWKDEVKIEGNVIGTDAIEFADLIKLDIDNKKRMIIKRFTPIDSYKQYVKFIFIDKIKSKNQMYYLKVKQRNKIRGRIVMAWSSPIWVLKEK